MNAIEVEHVSKQYPGFELKDISFTLPAGSILGLVGENGAGKSTTINLIMNAISRDQGSIKVLGCDNQSAQFQKVKEDIGVVLDEAYFPEEINAKQVNAIMKYTYKNWNQNCYYEYLQKFSLPEKKAFKDYSRGMRMKLALAVALSHDAKLLVLDEATSGLDPMVRDEILDIFNEYTMEENHTILLSSHIVSDLEKICDYIGFIHKGKLILCEEKDRLMEEYAIARVSEHVYESLPKEAVKGVKRSKFGVEVFMERRLLPRSITPEHASLEDMILFLAKGGKIA